MPSRLKEIVELVGLAAILIGIYLVYSEIQQNTQIARAELASETNEYLRSIQEKLSDPQFAAIYVKARHSPYDLTETERLQLNAFFEQLIVIFRREWWLFNLGVFGETETIPRMLAPMFLASGYGEIWWNERKDTYNLSDKVQVDEALSAFDGANLILELDQRIIQQIGQQRQDE